MPFKRRWVAKVENVEVAALESPLLDLPELALETILAKLPRAELCSMSAVCRSLRERCRSDHLWERHMREKWGPLLGSAARKRWEMYFLSRLERSDGRGAEHGWWKQRTWLEAVSPVWPRSWIKSSINRGIMEKPRSLLPDGLIMSWYLYINAGKFWFPAQVYNREHGHVGFLLSCYDADLSYDRHTDTFNARYPPHGRRLAVVEQGVHWDRIRAPPIETPAYNLHVSDSLSHLRPDDHIEIQWRRNKEFPYGWWYGVVGHMEPCSGNNVFCCCHLSDTIVLEFSQFTPGSRWRRASISRKDRRGEESEREDGFYGGIRKLQSKDEISKWRQLCPVNIL